MSGKRKINESHPDFSKYMKKFEELWERYRKLEEAERAKYPDWKGKDHPAHEVLRPAYRKCCEDMKALQKEYSYLFEEVE